MAKEKQKLCNEGKNYYWFFIPACLLIGIGIGFILSRLVAFTLIGLGVGFLLMGLTRMFCR